MGQGHTSEAVTSDAITRLMSRAVTAFVIEPRDRPQDFAKALHHLLQTRGMAAYFGSVGASPRDLLAAARETPPDTSVIFIQYSPGHFAVLGLILASIRWRIDGRRVVVCRSAEPFQRWRQRLAYRLLVSLIALDLPIRGEAAATLAGWPPRRLPPRSRLAIDWSARGEHASIDEIIGLLRRPRCREPLARSVDRLVCSRGDAFPVVDGIPLLLPMTLDLDLDRHARDHPAGDAYDAGRHPGWREIGFFKRDLIARSIRSRRRPRASIDIGCGDWGLHHDITGAIGTDLAVAGDVSLELVRHARRASAAPGQVHHLVFAAEALPFKDGIFDLTYCSEVLEHLARPDLALAEMRRTSDGGRAIITIPNEKLTGKLDDGHVRSFGYDDLIDLVRPHLDVSTARGVFWFRERDIDGLYRTVWGRTRLALYLRAAAWLPRDSMNVVIDGTFTGPRTGGRHR